MAEASSPHGQIEAKIRSLAQIPDSSHGTDGDQPGNNKQRKGSSQMTQQTDESRDSLGFQDNAVISYQLAADGGRKPTDYCTSPEDKQARGQARLQKKRQARRRKNRSKKEETPENGEHQRVTDGRKDRSTNEKGRSNGSRKQSDRKKTPEALSQKNGFEKAKEEVATGSKNHVSTRDSDQKGDGSIANSNRPSTSQGTVDSTNTVEQEEKNELDIALAEDFILAQNLYYKKEIVKECEKECIFLLKKKSSKFPTAKFFCRLCDYHCFDMEHCESHKKESRHKRLMKMRLIDQLLNHLPYPEPAHKQAVDDTVEKIYEEQHLTDSHLQERRELLGHIQKLIENSYKDDIHLVMYGSSHCTLGLRSSDVNMDFTNNVPPSYLKDAYLQLKENQNYVEDIESDFFAKVPSIRFVVSGMKLRCQLAINNTCCHKTSELLHTYSRIDTRLAKLAVVFRYLAKLCKMDKQEEGTLPSYVFYLMTVFFLQQCKPPVLPVLHEIGRPECTGQDSEDWYFKDVDRLGEYWVGQNQCCVGDLWIQMLRFYCIEFDIGNFVINIRQTKLLTRQEKKWTSKKLAIEDPFMRRRNVANCVSHSQVFEYILEQFKVAYKHFGIPQLSTGPLFSDMAGLNKYLKRREDGVIKHVLTNKDASEDCDGDRCSSAVLTDIRQSEANVVHEKSDMVLCSNSSQDFSIETWVRELVNGIFDAAMEQFASEKCPAENLDDVCGAISLEQMEDSAHQHSSMLSDSHVPCGDAEIFISEHKHSTDDVIGDSPGMTNTDKPVDDSQEKTESLAMDKDGLDGTPENTPNPTTTIGIIKSGDVIEITSTDTMTTSATEDPDEDNVDGDNAVMCPDIFNSGSDTVPSLGDKHTNVLKPVELIFSFDEKHLSDSKGPAIMCSICQREGHLKSSCPEENLPPLSPLPPLGRQYGDALDYLIQKVPKDFKPTEWEMKMRHGVVCEVERDIQETYPGAKLKVFGSSCNGFGFRGSDLDICLTFADMSSLASADPVAIIEQLAKVLKRQKTLYNVFPITTAKVPIVKFKHRPLQLEGDISLYNTLAIENTRMLQLYSAIDRRVVYLGYMMKVLAKICEICDASRGSLSSYAYILMVIYFLQQRQPPVIPVLQELIPKKGKKPEKIIDGWNSWFFDDLSQLPKVWPDYGKNTESPADLWLGLLCFYTEQFSFKEYVISIRQKVPLTKFERLWNTSTIAIEDPFDLSHNLGAGLSRRMNMFIIRTLRNARKLFGTNIYSIPNGYKSLEDYLFDPNLLTDSLPPSDRNCHRCGKIGHFAKECPLVELRKEGEEENRRQRQQQQRQHQQQQQQQWQQQQQAKKKKEMTISTPVPIPQAKAQMSHVHGSPDYARSTVLMSQDYHRGQHTPDSVQQMIRLNARYSPTANKQQPHSKREARCGKPDKRNPRIFVNRNFKSGPSETS